MNPAPDQVPTVSNQPPSVVSGQKPPLANQPTSPENQLVAEKPPSSIPTSSPPPTPDLTTNKPNTASESPPSIPSSVTSAVSASPPPPPKKFPFMLVTLFLGLSVLGFTGSFLYFRFTASKDKSHPIAQIVTTPTVPPLSSPTVFSNPFATPSAAMTNPFASPTATLANPFGSYENPFTAASKSADQANAAYQNPFEKLK